MLFFIVLCVQGDIPKISTEERSHIVYLKAQGYSNRNIGSRLGVHHETVAKLLRIKDKFKIITNLQRSDHEDLPMKIHIKE